MKKLMYCREKFKIYSKESGNTKSKDQGGLTLQLGNLLELPKV